MAMTERRINPHPDAPDQNAERRRQPGAQGTDPRDAIDESGNLDREKLKENQNRLGVDEDHRTEDMKKGDRGTFP